MDQTLLVIDRIGDGRKLIEYLAVRHFEMLAAFWLYTNDDESWRLNLVSRAVEAEGSRSLYTMIHRAFRELPNLQIDPIFGIRLLGASQPLARGILRYLKQYPSPEGKIVERTSLGGVYVESAYIYPPSLLQMPEPVTGANGSTAAG